MIPTPFTDIRRLTRASAMKGLRCRCGNRGTLLCDWKVATNKSGTCDAPLCRKCTTSPAPDKDLCANHAAEWKARQVTK